MTSPAAGFSGSHLALEADNEVVPAPGGQGATRLIADAGETGGALSIVRSQLALGGSGPGPHQHATFAEALFVVEGALDVLSGKEIVTLEAGDLVVVAPRTVHAFAAHPGHSADVLIVAAPGMDRFDYFRGLGQQVTFPPPQEFQERFDNYYLSSEVWSGRGRAPGAPAGSR